MVLDFYTRRKNAFHYKWKEAIGERINRIAMREINRWITGCDPKDVPMFVTRQYVSSGIYLNRIISMREGDKIILTISYDKDGIVRTVMYRDTTYNVLGDLTYGGSTDIYMENLLTGNKITIARLEKSVNEVGLYSVYNGNKVPMGIYCVLDPDNQEYYREFITPEATYSLKYPSLVETTRDGHINEYTIHHNGFINKVIKRHGSPEYLIENKKFIVSAYDDKGFPYRMLDIEDNTSYDVYRVDKEVRSLNSNTKFKPIAKIVSEDMLYEYNISSIYTTGWLTSSFLKAIYNDEGLIEELTIDGERLIIDMEKMEERIDEYSLRIKPLGKDPIIERYYHKNGSITAILKDKYDPTFTTFDLM